MARLNYWDGSAWQAVTISPARVALASDSERYVGGNITISATTWSAIAGPGDLVVRAAEGDTLLIGLSATFLNATASVSMDAYTMVSGSPVNKISGGDGGVGTDYGVNGWSSDNTGVQNVGCAVQYVVQADDIESGTVTLRLYAVRFTNNKTLVANSGQPLQFNVANLGSMSSVSSGYVYVQDDEPTVDPVGPAIWIDTDADAEDAYGSLNVFQYERFD